MAIVPIDKSKAIVLTRVSGRTLTKEIPDNRVYIPRKLFTTIRAREKTENLLRELETKKNEINNLVRKNEKKTKRILELESINMTLQNKIESLESSENEITIRHLETSLKLYEIYCFVKSRPTQLIACGNMIKKKECKGSCLELNLFLENIGVK